MYYLIAFILFFIQQIYMIWAEQRVQADMCDMPILGLTLASQGTQEWILVSQVEFIQLPLVNNDNKPSLMCQ